MSDCEDFAIDCDEVIQGYVKDNGYAPSPSWLSEEVGITTKEAEDILCFYNF